MMMIHSNVKVSIIISLFFILIAQSTYQPILLSCIFVLILISLWWSNKQAKSIPKVVIFGLTILALFSIYWNYKTLIGVDAGVAILSTFLFAKSLETKNKRDSIILFNFALFVSASSFLYSQSMWMALIVLCCLLSCLVGLYRLQVTDFEKFFSSQWSSLQQDSKHVVKFLLLALPFFVILFLFFPRLPPLWHIPISNQQAVTGMSDRMSPGDIAKLSQSSELAFRIMGDMEKLPPRSELYWRAMVLDVYDGTTWTSQALNQRVLDPKTLNSTNDPTFNYQYLAANQRVPWIMSLAKSVPLESNYLLHQDWSITPKRLMAQTQPIALKWLGTSVHETFSPTQLQSLQQLNTQVDETHDYQAQQLAVHLFQVSHDNPERYIQLVLDWYRQQNFSYTLSPGVLGSNRVDDFLFKTKQGFCEHYASSFVMLMRYVGIPARVVVGYQGGQLAPDSQSWEVRQSDAHAWAEVFLQQHWQRIDPTMVIAPARIDQGMQNYMREDQYIWGTEKTAWHAQRYAILTQLRIWSDYASYQWQSKVVGYNAESQKNWFTKFGLSSSYASVFVLCGGILGVSGLYIAWIFYRQWRDMSVYQRCIQRFSRMIEPELKQQPTETFVVWLSRLALLVPPSERDIFEQVITHYQQARYSSDILEKEEIEFLNKQLKYCAYILRNSKKNLS